MAEEKLSQEEQLFIHLISSFSTSAWIGLGKLKNPATDKVEKDLQQASFSIDMLDMILKRMEGNLSAAEKRFLGSTIGDLKLNFVEELKKSEQQQETPSQETKDESAESKSARGEREQGGQADNRV